MLLPFRNSKDTMSKQLITQEYNLHFREKKTRPCVYLKISSRVSTRCRSDLIERVIVDATNAVVVRIFFIFILFTP